jgi:hypothetical protein
VKPEPQSKTYKVAIIMKDGMLNSVYIEDAKLDVRLVVLEGPYGDESQIGIHSVETNSVYNGGFESMEDMLQQMGEDYGFFEQSEEDYFEEKEEWNF